MHPCVGVRVTYVVSVVCVGAVHIAKAVGPPHYQSLPLTAMPNTTHTGLHSMSQHCCCVFCTACMREQLSQAIINQQSLTLERDQAREQARLATERADKLQKQLDLLRNTHGVCVYIAYECLLDSPALSLCVCMILCCLQSQHT